MMRQQKSKSATLDHKKKLLQTVYRVYADWVKCFPLACQRGCAACCTQSVTMTSLEGEVILDFIQEKNRNEWLREKLVGITPGKSGALITTNQFAEACLKQQAIAADIFEGWDFNPCIFLEDTSCSIYEVRPFGCRSFGSRVRCTAERAAEMAPIHLTVNTVFTQIIEHISSDDGHWSRLADILRNLMDGEYSAKKVYLLKAQPVPGFLLEPQEVLEVEILLKRLSRQSHGIYVLSDLIDKFTAI